jgi:hypothetical protein
MKTSLKKTLLAALVVPAIALTAACTGGSDVKATSGSHVKAASGGSVSAPAAEPTPANLLADQLSPERGAAANLNSAREDFAAATSSRSSADAPDQAPADVATQQQDTTQTQAITSKGQVSLHSPDIAAARFKLQELLDTLDGTIADEQSDANKKGETIRQRLVLRVPSAKFGKAMDQISGLGTLVSRSRSSKDVTTQVIDNKTRVRTQRASLARVQALLARASSLREIISVEAQLARRQADLDSLEAQQKYLADQTSLSTINVYLTVPDKKAAAHHKKDGHNFFSGLKAGWDHLGRSTNALLIGIGALLPFGVVLALVGFGVWTVRRRRNTAVVEA